MVVPINTNKSPIEMINVEFVISSLSGREFYHKTKLRGLLLESLFPQQDLRRGNVCSPLHNCSPHAPGSNNLADYQNDHSVTPMGHEVE